MKKTPKQRASTWAERLEYARWVRPLRAHGPEESDSAFAARAGLTQPWFSKWKGRDDVPPGREILAIGEALDVDWKWLAGQEGAVPPLPALWRDWFSARLGKPVAESDPRYITGEMDMIDPARDRKLTEAEMDEAREIRKNAETARKRPASKRA